MSLSVGSLHAYLELHSEQFDKGISVARQEMRAAATAAGQMGGAVDEAEVALVGAGRAAALASSGSAKFRVAQLSALAATERYNAVLADETASLGRLATAEAGVIRSQERLAAASPVAAIKAANTEAKATPGIMARTTSGLLEAAKASVGLGAAFGAFEAVRKVVDSGRDLTTSLNSIQAASQASDAQMGKVRAQAIAMGKDLTIPGATAVDAADAIDDLVRAGVKLPRAMQAARPALLLASAAQITTADSARYLGDVLDDFALPASQATKVASQLAAGMTHAGGGADEFFDAIKYVGPVARAAGVGTLDLTAAITELAKSGITGSLAGTGLRASLLSLAAPTAQAREGMKGLGVEAWTAQGNFVGFPRLFGQLHDAEERLTRQDFLKYVKQAFGKPSSAVITAFAHRGIEGFRQFEAVIAAGNVQKSADLMNRGLTASWNQIKKEATATGIDVYDGLAPGVIKVADLVGTALPQAVSVAADAVKPFRAAWDAAGDVLGPVAHWLGDLIGDLHPLGPVLKFVASDALAVWAAFKGYQIAKSAAVAIGEAVEVLQVKTTNALAAAQKYGAGWQAVSTSNITASQRQALSLTADRAREEAATTQAAATQARAAADQAEAYATLVAESDDASATMIANSQNTARALEEQAVAAEGAATTAAAAANTAADEVAVSGRVAALGWSGLLGPLAAVGLGVGLLVGMFHKSTTASKEATDAAQAYSDALSSGGKSELIGTIADQLDKANVPEELNKINKALGAGTVSGRQFVNAIATGGKPLDDMRAKLEAIVKAGTPRGTGAAGQILKLTPAAEAASKALAHLNTQSSTLTKQQAKDIATYKAIGTVAAPLQSVANQLGLTSDQVKTYGGMLGLAATKSGDLVNATKANVAAVGDIATAYNTANQATSDFLAAWQTFSQSSGTATDRAALIGATLKANAGDSLTFASAINSASGAVVQLGQDVSKKTLGSIVDLTTGTIRYRKAAAAPLISDLTAVQTAALNAATATYQHNRATEGGKRAADDAVAGYKGVETSLEGQLEKMGLSSAAAQKLTNKYLGVPSRVRTKIEQEGASPIQRVLNDIDSLLYKIATGHWRVKVGTSGISSAAAQLSALNRQLDALGGHSQLTLSAGGQLGDSTGHGAGVISNARGTGSGGLRNGWFTVGEEGNNPRSWELGHKSGGRVDIFSNAQSRAMTGSSRAPGYNGARSSLPAYAGGSSKSEVARLIAAMLKGLGVGRAGEAGAIGNAIIESGLNPHAYNAREGAIGLFQDEGGRRTALEALARRMGLSKWSAQAQIAYARHELTGSLRGVLSELRHAHSATQAAAIWDAQFERSSGDARGAREAAARRAYATLAGDNLAGLDSGSSSGGSSRGRSSRPATGPGARGRAVLGDFRDLFDAAHGRGDAAKALRDMNIRLRHAGLPASYMDGLRREDRRILDEVRRRNTAAAQLRKATAALAKARQMRHDDSASFRSAITGSFDITSAGVDSDTGMVTAGSILAAQTQQLAKIRAFVSVMRKLGAERVFPPAYLRQLAGQGPDALPTAQALLGLRGSALNQFVANEADIRKVGRVGGAAIAGVVDNPAAIAAARDIRRDRALETRLTRGTEKSIDRLGERLSRELQHLHLEGSLGMKRGQLWLAVQTDGRRSAHRRPTHPGRR